MKSHQMSVSVVDACYLPFWDGFKFAGKAQEPPSRL